MNCYHRLKPGSLARGGFSSKALSFSTSTRCANQPPSSTRPTPGTRPKKRPSKPDSPLHNPQSFMQNFHQPGQHHNNDKTHPSRRKGNRKNPPKQTHNSQHSDSAPREWSMLRRKSDKKPLNRRETTTFERALARQKGTMRQSLDTTKHPGSIALRSRLRISAGDGIPRTDIFKTLVLRGVKRGVQLSDFTRLVPSMLNSWNVGIESVRHMRSRKSFSPLDKWEVQFYSREAVVAFRDKVRRLQALAAIKAQRGSSLLWESSIPDNLHSPMGESPEELIQAFTIASGAQDDLKIVIPTAQQRLVSPWKHRILKLVKGDGYGAMPPLVLVEVYTPQDTDTFPSQGMTARLTRAIEADTGRRNMAWKVSKLHRLKSLDGEDHQQKTTKKKKKMVVDEWGDEQEIEIELKSRMDEVAVPTRYVVSAVNEAEARRFQRYWNAREIESPTTRFTIKMHYLPWNF